MVYIYFGVWSGCKYILGYDLRPIFFPGGWSRLYIYFRSLGVCIYLGGFVWDGMYYSQILYKEVAIYRAIIQLPLLMANFNQWRTKMAAAPRHCGLVIMMRHFCIHYIIQSGVYREYDLSLYLLYNLWVNYEDCFCFCHEVFSQKLYKLFPPTNPSCFMQKSFSLYYSSGSRPIFLKPTLNVRYQSFVRHDLYPGNLLAEVTHHRSFYL